MTTIKTNFFKILFLTGIIITCFTALVYCQQSTINKYQLHLKLVDKDTSFNARILSIQGSFANQPVCADYVNKLVNLLNTKGYASASIDSVRFDTSFAEVFLYLGAKQNWVELVADSIDKKALYESGFIEKNFVGRPVNISQLQVIKERIVNYYEKIGYPFAGVLLDSVHLDDSVINGRLKIHTGPLYHIDSIRVHGKIKISNIFLQHYLGIANKSLYNKEKLEQVSKRFLELPYLEEQQPSELTMLGSGAILDVYLQSKRSSQVNFLVGFLPANSQTNKLQITGDVNLHLRNSLGGGETILLNWQQLQIKSPRLNIGYQQPYIFKSSFGLDFGFDLFKKDSTYLQINTQLGIQYLLSASQSGKLFFQKQSTLLLGSGVDTDMVKITKTLPPNIDVSAFNIGLDYELNTTNYRFNPRSGNELRLISSVGIKTITKNNEILNLANASFNFSSLYDSVNLRSYQVRAKLTAAHYFPLGKRSAFKTLLNGGIFNSQNIFRNELFQIGGYKLLRGFDEESIYATQYVTTTAEYHYLAGLNSYFFLFMDVGWIKNKQQFINTDNNFISSGLGLVFETKGGLLNISFAIGKRNDVKLDLRQASKIHFGYINYF